uniref:GNAT family N-acetyltransferase n=1 Tax=Marinobacterium profundum TaxID=1714300 RepID=UPI000833AF49|nr:GNAT family protein [Marinobacterium profundum]
MADTTDLEQLYPRPLSGSEVVNPPPALVPGRIPLTGKYVKLEPQNAQYDAEELYEAGHSSEAGLRIWDYMNYGPWSDVSSYKGTLRAQSSSFDPIFYTIRSIETGRACGQVSFLDINAQNGVIEIGHIWFGPELQKTPAGTEALFLMLCHAMDDLGYRRMQWRCNSLNTRSRQAARRLGFRFEGIFYNHMIFKGKNRDTAWYSILDDEWPEVRQKLASWLKPSNFSAGNIPKASLTEMMGNRSDSTRG